MMISNSWSPSISLFFFLRQMLKLDLFDKKNYKYTKDKNLVWNQYTLIDS